MPDDARAGRPPFDPAKHMTRIRTKQGMQDYLPPFARVLWLRSEHPDASIVTDCIEGDAEFARFRCRISYVIPVVVGRDGGTDYLDIMVPADQRLTVLATGHGSETAADFPDFYEKAETKAVGRACAMLGYGTEGAEDIADRMQAGDAVDAEVVVTMAEPLEHAAQRWLVRELPRAGVVVPQRFERWGDVIGAMSKENIDLTQVLREGGINPPAVRALVLHLIEQRQQSKADS